MKKKHFKIKTYLENTSKKLVEYQRNDQNKAKAFEFNAFGLFWKHFFQMFKERNEFQFFQIQMINFAAFFNIHPFGKLICTR